jgi:hypothetical protein
MKRKLNILLVLQSGGDYDITDVLLLARKLVENSEFELDIRCLCNTTKKTQELENVKLIPMTDNSWSGWWSKMNMFSPKLIDFRPFLYVDLDTAITGNIDLIIPEENCLDFITLEDFYQPKKIGSAIMWIPTCNFMNYIWFEFIGCVNIWLKKYRGDQNFLFAVCKRHIVIKFWQNRTKQISSFKPEPSRQWLKKLPQNISIVCFHGKPRIKQAAKSITWLKNYSNE